MKYKKVDFDNLLTEYNIKFGEGIYMLGRPGIGKSATCCWIIEKYKDQCLYFDLSNKETSYWTNDKCIVKGFQTSAEIIKQAEDFVYNKNGKIIIIDSLNHIQDKSDWFFEYIINLCHFHKKIVIITSDLQRVAERCKYGIPTERIMKKFLPRYLWMKKIFVDMPIGRDIRETKPDYYVIDC